MLVATREIIVDKLLELPALMDLYQKGEVSFSVRAMSWLQDVEDALSRLRSPLTSLVARERARIIAAADGFRDPLNGEGRLSRRKSLNVTASLALADVEQGLVARVHSIDQKFDIWRDKLAQFISVASNIMPIPLPMTEPRQVWLANLWKDWQQIEETRAMHSYLNTVMAKADRLHLFGELLENHLNS